MMQPSENVSTTTQRVGSAGWWLTSMEIVDSTNDLAKTAAPWTAFVAKRQDSGRGRLGRRFVSDSGGIWLSAVCPGDGGIARWAGFSLAIGWHLLRMLERLGIFDARLRWPNDLMIGQKKIAGILIEQGVGDTLVVGFGMNVFNAPWDVDEALAETSTRLVDCLPECTLTLPDLTERVLDSIADAHEAMQTSGLVAIIDQLNSRWSRGMPVEIRCFDQSVVCGRFVGLDPSGNLKVADRSENDVIIPHQSIERLLESPPIA